MEEETLLYFLALQSDDGSSCKVKMVQTPNCYKLTLFGVDDKEKFTREFAYLYLPSNFGPDYII